MKVRVLLSFVKKLFPDLKFKTELISFEGFGYGKARFLKIEYPSPDRKKDFKDFLESNEILYKIDNEKVLLIHPSSK